MTARPGMTLPELLVYIFVLGLLVVVVSNLYVGAGQFNREENIRVEVGENAARVLATMDETLRQVKNVIANATINSVNYVTDANTLVVELPSITVTGDLSPTDTDPVAIFLDTSVSDNTRLRMLVDPHANSTRTDVDRILVEHVKDVYFRYNTLAATSATGVTVTVGIKQTTGDRTFTKTNILYATFRNAS